MNESLMLNSSPVSAPFATGKLVEENFNSRKKSTPSKARANQNGRAQKAIENSIGIVLADCHAVVRAGLALLLADTPGLHAAGEAGDETEVLAALKKHPAPIILLEHLGWENGLEFLPRLRQAAPDSRVIILTGCHDMKNHRRAISLGARGLVFKNQGVDVLLKAIRRVHAGELWIERELMHQALGEAMRPEADPHAEKIATLTAREREIVAEIGQGLKNKHIAERLFLSETTVRHHLTSIFGKLEVGDRLELVIYAYRHNLCCIRRD